MWRILEHDRVIKDEISTEAEARLYLKENQHESLYLYAENDSGDYIEDFDGPITIARSKGL